MKKIFALLFLCVSLCYAEDLTGVMGIKFGSSFEEVDKMMKEKGWAVSGNPIPFRDDYKSYMECRQETFYYGGIRVASIDFYFYKNKMYLSFIHFERIMSNSFEEAEHIENALIRKYDLKLDKITGTKFDGSSYYSSGNNNTLTIKKDFRNNNYGVNCICFTSQELTDLIEKEKIEKDKEKFNKYYENIKDEL